MAADVSIKRIVAGTPTVITDLNTRMHTDDVHSVAGVTLPVPIPISGFNYSYWVITALYADTSPAGTINNVKWFTDGVNDFGAGIGCVCGTATAVTAPTGTPGTSGDELTPFSYTGLSATVDAFANTEGSPLAVAGSITDPDTGRISDFLVYQIAVDNTAVPGVTGQETFTWQYDET